MSISIPFLTSETNYVLACPIDDEQILFDVRWNSRDSAWYMDMYEADDTVIELNIKIVLGVPLGRRSNHVWFENHLMLAVDSTGEGRDPGYDDLGGRVKVIIQTVEDFVGQAT